MSFALQELVAFRTSSPSSMDGISLTNGSAAFMLPLRRSVDM